jgi:hypothetical protein
MTMQLVRLWLVSWAVGFLSYVGFLALVFRQTLSGGDLPSVIVSSLLAYGLVFLLIYLPMLGRLRRLLGGALPAWPFPVMAALLGILPTLPVSARPAGRCRDTRTRGTPHAPRR